MNKIVESEGLGRVELREKEIVDKKE